MKNPLTLAPDSTVHEFLNAAHDIGRRRLALCSSGNLSLRLDDRHMLIKASRSWMENLGADQLAVCRIADGTPLEGPKPSVETGFHAGILRARPDARVVLHFQSPSATAIACRNDADRLNYNVTPETPYYIGPVAAVPYRMPGTPELAASVVKAAETHDLVILRNHGLVTLGASFEETIQRAVFFEMTCAILLQAGPRLKHLTHKEADALIALRGGGPKAV